MQIQWLAQKADGEQKGKRGFSTNSSENVWTTRLLVFDVRWHKIVLLYCCSMSQILNLFHLSWQRDWWLVSQMQLLTLGYKWFTLELVRSFFWLDNLTIRNRLLQKWISGHVRKKPGLLAVSPLAGGSSSNGERLLDLAWLLAWPRFECLDGLLIIPWLIWNLSLPLLKVLLSSWWEVGKHLTF